MTAIAGLISWIRLRIFSSSTSTRIRRSFAVAPSRFPRSLICRADSSPEQYRTVSPRPGHLLEHLQEERRFSDAGIAPDEDRGPGDDPAPEDAVHLGDSCREPLPLVGRDGIDRLGNAFEPEVGRMRRIAIIPHLLLDEPVPLAAGGALAQPFRRLLTAFLAEEHRPDLFHGAHLVRQSVFLRIHTASPRLRQRETKKACAITPILIYSPVIFSFAHEIRS